MEQGGGGGGAYEGIGCGVDFLCGGEGFVQENRVELWAVHKEQG